MITNDHELITEMRMLRDQVMGVTDMVVVTTDGLLIAADTGEAVDLDRLAAVAAATLGLAAGSGKAMNKGAPRQTTAEYSDGFLVVRPVGAVALMAVLGDLGMDVARLHVQSQAVAERINRLLTAPEEAEAASR